MGSRGLCARLYKRARCLELRIEREPKPSQTKKTLGSRSNLLILATRCFLRCESSSWVWEVDEPNRDGIVRPVRQACTVSLLGHLDLERAQTCVRPPESSGRLSPI